VIRVVIDKEGDPKGTQVLGMLAWEST